MKAILQFLGNIIGIIELPIINMKQRNGLEKWSLFMAPLRMLLKIAFMPFKFLWSVGFDYYDKRLPVVRTMFFLSGFSWIFHIVGPTMAPKVCETVYGLPLPNMQWIRQILTNCPMQLYNTAMNLFQLSGTTGNVIADSPVGFIGMGLVGILLLILAVYFGFIFYGIAQTPVMTLIWLVCFIVAIFQTIGQMQRYGETWFDCCRRDFVHDNVEWGLLTMFLDWVQWIVYFIPVVNVIAYRIWMIHDKKYGYYRAKPLCGTWSSADFFGAKNTIHSTFVV